MRRRDLLGAVPASILLAQTGIAKAAPGKKGVMMMNRIGPSSSELFIADIDGSNERPFFASSGFDYHASFSHDGKWVVFTTERNGDGNSDLYRAHVDGTGVQKIASTPSMEDAGAISPDGRHVAFVSTADGYHSNVWVVDLHTGHRRNLTGTMSAPAADPTGPGGYFRPSWSPDGKWIAFSSDRDTPWRGHDGGHGWEHTQALSIYVVRPDGSEFRKIATKPDYCLGSPKWSPDGKRVVFYELTTEHTWGAHRPEWIGRVDSQIVSVDVASGDRVEHTQGPGLKLFPQYVTADEIGYLIKDGPNEGLAYTSNRPALKRPMRSPSWSPDGKHVIYEKVGFKTRAQDKPLYSWDPDWEYRFTDVFPVLSKQGMLAITEKQNGTSSIVVLKPNGTERRVVFDTMGKGVDPKLIMEGLGGAFQPTWSPDGEWIAFGMGVWFQMRAHGKATIMRAKADGSHYEALTDGTIHSGFPSYSPDGKFLVFRQWSMDGAHKGLRVMDLDTKNVRVLTDAFDNLPFWSPDGKLIVFTRKDSPTNFGVYTIRPDGSGLTKVAGAEGPAGPNNGHAVWSADGRILYNSGFYGFRDEAAIYDATFQPYGQIFTMNADGSDKRMVTDSMWEDSMPIYIPNEYLS